MKSDESNSDLSHNHLGVELDESPPAGLVEGSPGLDEECLASTTDGEIDLAHHSCLVERHDGLLALGKQSGFNAGEGDGGWEKDSKTDEDVGRGDGEEAQAERDHLGAVFVLHGMAEMLATRMRDTKCECDSDGQDQGRLLCHGVHQSWEEESLAFLAGWEAAVPGFRRRVGDHLVCPCHMETREAEGHEDVAECFTDDAKAEEAGEQVGEDGVDEMVKPSELEASPSRCPAADTLEVANCSCDLGCDRLVVDDGDFDIGISVSLGHQRLLLERCIGLGFSVWRWLGFDDSGAGW